jgi:ribosomal protein S18 acetylase RimI-like enzyme
VILRRIETSGFIPFLGVLPDQRRQGIGTSLAKFALNRLYELGAYKVALYNVNEDQQTLRMLDKFDFAVTLKQVEMVKRL